MKTCYRSLTIARNRYCLLDGASILFSNWKIILTKWKIIPTEWQATIKTSHRKNISNLKMLGRLKNLSRGIGQRELIAYHIFKKKKKIKRISKLHLFNMLGLSIVLLWTPVMIDQLTCVTLKPFLSLHYFIPVQAAWKMLTLN